MYNEKYMKIRIERHYIYVRVPVQGWVRYNINIVVKSSRDRLLNMMGQDGAVSNFRVNKCQQNNPSLTRKATNRT